MKRFSVFTLFIVLGLALSAQNSKISSVFKFNPNHLFTIKTGNEVKGYIAFYVLDKKDSRNNNYIMQLYDENMNEVGQKKISMPNTQYLDEVGYDGNVILVKFDDLKTKSATYIAYNQKAEEVGRKTRLLSKLDYNSFVMYTHSNQATWPTFYSVEGAGFVDYANEQNKKIGYSINFLNGEDIKKGWVYSSDKGTDKIVSASYLANSENTLLSMIMQRDNLYGKNLEYHVLGLDVKSGKKTCDIKCANAKYAYTPMGAYVESDKFVVVGQFIASTGNVLKDPGLGLCVVEYDFTGKVLLEKYTLWKDGLGKYAEMKGNKLLNGGFVYFHKIVKAPDGNIVLVGEQFYRDVNGIAVAAAVLGGGYGGNMTKLVIGDFLFLEMSPSYDLIGYKRFEKGKSDFSMQGLDYMGANIAAMFAKATGNFDYDYTTFKEDKSDFSVVYTDYDKLEGSKKNEMYVGNISYNGGKYTIDKVPYHRGADATLFRTYAAKNGYFMLLTYTRKTKELNMNLVKFNN